MKNATDSHYRRVAQLAEHRSPKPGVAGSIPASPALKARQRRHSRRRFGCEEGEKIGS